MNKGLEIIMARMDSNPEEFTVDIPMLGKGRISMQSRWERFFNVVLREYSFAPQEDREVLLAKLWSIQGDAFTKAVLKELFTGETDEGARMVTQVQENPNWRGAWT